MSDHVMNKGDDINIRLLTLQQQMADIRTLSVIGMDGRLIASTVSAETNIDALTEGVAILQMARRMLNTLDSGSFQQLFIHGEKGYVVITDMENSNVFVASTKDKIKLALILLDLKRIAIDLAPLL